MFIYNERVFSVGEHANVTSVTKTTTYHNKINELDRKFRD